MPIYLLGARTRQVKIPSQAMSISISGAVDNAALYAAVGEGQHVVRVNPHAMIVPAICEEITVGVAPRGRGTFDHDAVIHLTIGAESPDEVDPVQVTFEVVNVSGCGATELATLSPHGGSVEIAVRSGPDTPLSALASMARTAARRGVDGRGSPQGQALSIGIDASASMRWAFADGSVAAAVDVVVGVADGIGIRDVTASLVGRRRTRIDAAPAGLAQAVSGASVRWSAGVDWALVSARDSYTVAITDSEGLAQKAGLLAVRVCDGGAGGGPGPALPTPPGTATAEQYLTANPELIDEVAIGLLSSLTVPC